MLLMGSLSPRGIDTTPLARYDGTMNRQNLRDLLMLLVCAALYLSSVYLLLDALLVPAQIALTVALIALALSVLTLKFLMDAEMHTWGFPVALLYFIGFVLLLCGLMAQLVTLLRP